MGKTAHHVFHAMGIPVHITLVGLSERDAKRYAEEAERIFRAYDERFSRFKETSELHKLNTGNGEWRPVSLPLFQVLQKCVSLAKETDGAFDPSVGGILASYGYGLPKNSLPTDTRTYRNIEFNERELSVRLASGQILEPASVVKGMAIDKAGEALSGVPGFLINAGGDILTHGAYENGTAWNIAVQDPRSIDAVVSAVAIRDKGMATSGTYQTKGIHNGKEWHHLIDMRTGNPADGFTSATIIAPTCEEADTEASLAILLAPAEAIARLESRRLPYYLISKDGIATKNAEFSALEIPISTTKLASC
ncbi:MAG: FAD:protein FMN transferase [Candidatus Yonathbacteria bacterium]|nr:FAD:protein FMN transferase [Candidatus Yonathbacteria bacterium]